MSSAIREYGLIFADDINDPERALFIAKEVSPYMDAIKLHVPNTLRELSLFSKVKEATDKPIIADFKTAEIGFWNDNTNQWEGQSATIVNALLDAGADYITCHTFPATSSIQECIEVAHAKGGKILTLPYMSGVGAELFFSQPIHLGYTNRTLCELGIPIDTRRLHTISDLILALGEYFNVDGYIGPANVPEVLRRYRHLTQRPIYAPGIGRQARNNLSPQEQLEQFYKICGRNSAVIIGSSIYNALDPTRSAEEFKVLRDVLVGY
jgi:orotidine-5'-phosphate decarboxylase